MREGTAGVPLKPLYPMEMGLGIPTIPLTLLEGHPWKTYFGGDECMCPRMWLPTTDDPPGRAFLSHFYSEVSRIVSLTDESHSFRHFLKHVFTEE